MRTDWTFILVSLLFTIGLCTIVITLGYVSYISYQQDHEFRTRCILKGNQYINTYGPGHCLYSGQNISGQNIQSTTQGAKP